MMMEYLLHAAAQVMLIVVIYGLAAFVSWQPDVSQWDSVGRAFVVTLWPFGAVLTASFTAAVWDERS
jgi:hypothetical protein